MTGGALMSPPSALARATLAVPLQRYFPIRQLGSGQTKTPTLAPAQSMVRLEAPLEGQQDARAWGKARVVKLRAGRADARMTCS